MGKGKMPFIDIHSLNVEKEYNEREEMDEGVEQQRLCWLVDQPSTSLTVFSKNKTSIVLTKKLHLFLCLSMSFLPSTSTICQVTPSMDEEHQCSNEGFLICLITSMVG
jgi:hypothetical protein